MMPIIRPKRDHSEGDKSLLYLFKDKHIFAYCKQKGCSLIASGGPANLEDIHKLFNLEEVRELTINFAPAICTEIWRLNNKLKKIKEMLPHGNSEIDSFLDQAQRIMDTLNKYEIEIKDHTGDDYSDSMSVKVLHFEVGENLPKGKLIITDTIKPSIYFRKQIISHGEVIVAKSRK